jgi:hypothetical protein
VLEDDGALSGRIYFHRGDDSSFHATRVDEEPKRDTKAQRGPRTP